ncbi:transposase [Acetobacter malorum]|uniref:transposase n=1 Tax=Acetobacter malorum TaxID=178901 RepID=UPI00248EE924|nr:transposase [Acetobacter malorum]
MEQIRPLFPLAHGVPRVDDRCVLSGIVYVIRKGLPWKDAPKAYAPPKTLYNPLSGGAVWASLTGYLSR